MGKREGGKKENWKLQKKARPTPTDKVNSGSAAGPTLQLGAVKGKQAVLATCFDCKEREAVKELLNLLNTEADKLFPATSATSSAAGAAEDGACDAGSAAADDASLSIEEQIRLEAKELRAGAGEDARFAMVPSETRGVLIICALDPNIDVSRLVSAIFADVRATRERKSRYLVRLSPMSVTCFANLEELVRAAKPLVEAALPASEATAAAAATSAVAPATAISASAAPEAGGDLSAAPGETSAAATPAAVAVGSGPTDAAASGEAVPGLADVADAAAPAAAVPAAAPGPAPAASGASPVAASNGTKDAAGAGAAPAAGGAKPAAAPKAPRPPVVAAPGCLRYRVDLNRRGTGFSRDPVIKALAKMVSGGHKVDLANPEVTIIVEGVRSLCGISVVRDFVESRQYNLRQLQDDLCNS